MHSGQNIPLDGESICQNIPLDGESICQNIPLDGESILARLTELVGVPGHESERERLSEQWARLCGLPKTPPLLAGPTEFREDLAADPNPVQQDEPDPPPVAGIPAIEHLQAAFDRGREQGQREILQRLFRNVSTSQELTDRAALMVFAATWPDDQPCPLSASDLAAITGVSRRTAERRVQKAKLSHSFPDEH